MTPLSGLCVRITDGKHGDCTNEEGSGYFFISCKDVRDGWVDYSAARQITRADYEDTHRRTQLEPDDILVTNSGTIGRMALVPARPETGRTTFQKSVAILKPEKTKVDPRWLYYALIANRARLIAWAGGTAQKNLLLRDMRAFEVSVPARETQGAVAAVLSAYDDLIENNTKRIKILEEMARALYREWFVHFRFPGHEKAKLVDSPMGKIPEGWEAFALGELVAEARNSVKPGDLPEETPCFGLEHLPRRSITLSDWGRFGDVQSTKLVANPGDILFGKIRPYFHKVGVCPIFAVCSSDTIILRPTDAKYFALGLSVASSDDFVQHATQSSQGTKMPRANWKILKNYMVAVPPPALLTQLSSFIESMIDQLRNFVFQNRNLHATRDLLLPKLISGDINVDELDPPEASAA